MSKKNSSVNLKKVFTDNKDLSKIFLNFKNKLDNLNEKSYLIAVSGGPDSLALVALSQAYALEKKIKFYYVLVNHNIRNKSLEEANKVKNLLKKKKINLITISNKKKITKNIQAEARNVRYDILSRFCKKKKIVTIVTAHNLEDQVETFLIRLSRGSGLKGLSSMKMLSKINKQVYLFRPLLEIKKKFLIKISKIAFGKFFIDPSNKNLKYLRTKVRNLKKPLEKSGIKYDQIFKSIQNLSLSKDSLDEYMKRIFKELIKKNNREVLINFKKYKKLSNDIKIAVINESVKKIKNNYYDLRSKKVNNLINVLNKKNFKRSTLGGCFFSKKGENICLKAEKI